MLESIQCQARAEGLNLVAQLIVAIVASWYLCRWLRWVLRDQRPSTMNDAALRL